MNSPIVFVHTALQGIKLSHQNIQTNIDNWLCKLSVPSVHCKFRHIISLHKFLFHPIHMVPPAELLNVFLAWMEGVEEEMAVLNFIYLFFSWMCIGCV